MLGRLLKKHFQLPQTLDQLLVLNYRYAQFSDYAIDARILQDLESRF